MIYLFVSFEVRSKEIVFQCDGIFDESFIEFTDIYYLNERTKYLGTKDKKERKTRYIEGVLDLIKKNFKKTDQEFSFSILHDFFGQEVKRGKYKEIFRPSKKVVEILPSRFISETITLNRYDGTIRHSYKTYVYNSTTNFEIEIDTKSLFTGSCKKVERKF